MDAYRQRKFLQRSLLASLMGLRPSTTCPDCYEPMGWLGYYQRNGLVLSKTTTTFVVSEYGRTRDLRIASVDHVIPQWKGGSSEKTNLQAVCVPCNWQRCKADPSYRQLARWKRRLKRYARLLRGKLSTMLLLTVWSGTPLE